MSNTDYLPRKDKDFLSWIINLLKNLFPILTRIGFPDDQYQKLAAERNDFAQKLETAEEPATHTPVTVEAKKEARKLLETDIRAMVKAYLTYNLAVTDEDRKAMGLPIHKSGRTPSPLATSYPIGRADTGMLRQVTIHFADQHAEDTAKAKPAGQHAAEIRWVKRESTDPQPVNISELINSTMDTHTPCTLHFEGEDRGKILYFALCWENMRTEKGPYSPIETAVIP